MQCNRQCVRSAQCNNGKISCATLAKVAIQLVAAVQFQLDSKAARLDMAGFGVNWFKTKVYHIQSHNGGLSEEKRKERNRLGLTSV